MDERRNIVLIGMPGVGKSTAGVLVAKMTGRNFVDTDVCIQAGDGRSLQQIIAEDGLDTFRKVEESYMLCLDMQGYVVATGGSVIYSTPGMTHLSEHGTIVFLDAPLSQIADRISDHNTRGMVIRPGMTLEDLYRERLPLYRRWAQRTVNCDGLDQQQTAQAILAALDE